MPGFVSSLEFLETLREKLGVLRAIIYIRQSWEEDGTISPDIQDDECTGFANGHRIDIVDVVRDIDLSGGTFDKRKVASIISRVGDGEANIVLVLYRNRWGRSDQNDAFEAELNRAGGTLIAVKNPLDPTSASGRQGIEVDNFISVMQRRTISEAWRNTHNKRRNDGVPHAGGIRFGYEGCPNCVKDEFVTASGRKRKRFVKCEECRARKKPRPQTPNEDIGPDIEDFLIRWLDGEKTRVLAQEKYNKGIRSIRGNRMSASQWLTMFDTGFVFGYIRSRRVPVGTKGMPVLYKGKGIESYDVWVKGEHKPIIKDPALWERYKKKRGLSTGTQPTGRSAKYPLVNWLVCGRPRETPDGKPVIDQDGNPIRCLRPMHGKYVVGKRAVRGADGKTVKGPDGKTLQEKYNLYIYFCSESESIGAQCKGLTISMNVAHQKTRDWLVARARGEGALAAEMERLTKSQEKAKLAAQQQKRVEDLKAQLMKLTENLTAGLVSNFAYNLTAPKIEGELAAAQKMFEQYTEESKYEAAPAPEVFMGIAEMWEDATDEEKRLLIGPVLGRVVAYKTPDSVFTQLEFVPRWEVSS